MRRVLMLTLTVVGIGLTLPAPAAAQSDGTRGPQFNGPCTASATIDTTPPTRIDPKVSGGVYTVPIEGSANYEGSVPEGPSPRPISGKVEILTPPLFPNISIDDKWTWDDDEATGFSSTGTVFWDLPSVVPRGVELTVSGYHKENGVQVCSGRVTIEFEGGFFDSPLTPIALVGTAISGAMVFFSGLVKGTTR